MKFPRNIKRIRSLPAFTLLLIPLRASAQQKPNILVISGSEDAGANGGVT
jgi:hypothetical protein